MREQFPRFTWSYPDLEPGRRIEMPAARGFLRALSLPLRDLRVNRGLTSPPQTKHPSKHEPDYTRTGAATRALASFTPLRSAIS
jgi:hypothetical protein